MDLAVAIRSILLAAPSVTAIVGDRIHPAIIPEGREYPALTFDCDEEPDLLNTGLTGVVRADVEVTAWARPGGGKSGYRAVNELAHAVQRALLAAKGEVGDQYIMAVTGGRIERGSPDMTADIWQAWITVHVIARRR